MAQYEKKSELFELLSRFSFFELASPLVFAAAPASWQGVIEESESCLQQGNYLRAAQTLTTRMEEDGKVYAQLADMLFMIEACAGLIRPAVQRVNNMIRRAESAGEARVAAQYEYMLARFTDSFESESALKGYLSEASGNYEYALPETFEELKAKLVTA